MAFEINIKPEDVDQLVKDTILKAGIGRVIQDAVAKAISPHSYNNPIDEELKRYITTVVRGLLETDFKDQVATAVRSVLEQKVTQPIIETLAEKTIDKIVKAAEDRY